jgi:hypothetical protein
MGAVAGGAVWAEAAEAAKANSQMNRGRMDGSLNTERNCFDREIVALASYDGRDCAAS